MFFERPEDIKKIATKVNSAIFVMPDAVAVKLPRVLVMEPDGKSVITIEQVREILARLNMKQISEQFVLIRPAEALGEEAANAMLKTLEEPGERIHFVLITSALSRLLPTIISRSAVYFLKTVPDIDAGIDADEKTKALAKRLISARGAELTAVVDEICKKKDGVRGYALLAVGTAIQMLYKSYFITGKVAFATKIPGFVAAYEAIEKNGHIKLQIVANLL